MARSAKSTRPPGRRTRWRTRSPGPRSRSCTTRPSLDASSRPPTSCGSSCAPGAGPSTSTSLPPLSEGAWRGDYYAWDRAGLELGGTTVGLIGYGAIGRRVARLLHAFGAEILVADPYLDGAEIEVGERVEVSELLERSQVVSLHARLSEETRGMIGRAEIARMPRGSVLVNTARGELLDTAALCDALDSGHLAAPALDVFDQEPLPGDSRLLRTPRLVATPHLAGATRQTARRAARIAAEEVARYASGEPLRHAAHPAVLSRASDSTAP